ncbi:MAG: WYL domain-containing protein, partial [Streptococcaceae bacterium]|nr:WYL domain-containing protein [Streptococcaceae bacterium]
MPSALVIEENEEYVVIEAIAYSQGVKMWLLSQGKMVQVLSPDWFVEEMKEEIRQMGLFYDLFYRYNTYKYCFCKYNKDEEAGSQKCLCPSLFSLHFK